MSENLKRPPLPNPTKSPDTSKLESLPETLKMWKNAPCVITNRDGVIYLRLRDDHRHLFNIDGEMMKQRWRFDEERLVLVHEYYKVPESESNSENC